MNESNLKWFFNVTLRDKTNPLFGPHRRKKLKGIDFTIISNNCWGGHVYRWYNLPYLTPTVGLYFWAKDYLKFVSNIRYYTKERLVFLKPNHSRNFESLKKLNQLNVPIGLIDDIEIVFLHYKSEAEAREKWERRSKRINWEHLLIKNSYQNGCNDEIMHEFLSLNYKCKLFFVGKNVELPNTVVYKNRTNELNVKEDTMYFNRYLNLTNWINRSYE